MFVWTKDPWPLCCYQTHMVLWQSQININITCVTSFTRSVKSHLKIFTRFVAENKESIADVLQLLNCREVTLSMQLSVLFWQLFWLHNTLLIFDSSLKTWSIPQDWRDANVSLLFKKGKKQSLQNYRPVNLTSYICKIMESLLKDVTVEHLETNHLIREPQHGFRRGKSCLSNLI